jgi:hypothetical protein
MLPVGSWVGKFTNIVCRAFTPRRVGRNYSFFLPHFLAESDAL